jgi:predicted transcriptional regulator
MPSPNFKKDVCPAVIKFMAFAEDDMNICQIQEKIRIMYSHILNMVRLLKSKGMIFTKKQGRELKITFTEKGNNFKYHCTKITEIWKGK